MLSMLKLSAILLLLSSTLVSANADLKKFLEKSIKKNPNIVTLNVEILSHAPVKQMKGFEAYVVKLTGVAKFQGKEKPITQNSVYFVKDGFVTTELINMKTGDNLANLVGPSFKKEFYKKENLISGNVNAKHKVAVFSDPLCPFCKNYAPKALEYMKKYPNDFALYYFHFPLPSLHPAAVAITKAAIAAEKKGFHNVAIDMYKININAREKDEKKIVAAFNKVVGSKISVADIHTPSVEAQFKADQEIAAAMLVRGTPTVFFDGKKDAQKMKYKSVKVN